MTHDEIVGRLEAYAAGVLEASDRSAVQAHLAEGCQGCLAGVFAAPVGKPRPLRATAPVRARPSPWPVVAVLGVVLALAVALFLHERRVGEGRVAEVLARVDEATRRQAELRDRLLVAKAVLRSQRRMADAEQEVLARGAEEAVAEVETLRAELRQGRQRLSQLEAELAGGRLASEVIAGEGLELRALRPAPPFERVRGHVLWRPADGEMVVYAFGLPPAPAGEGYEARVIVGSGRLFSTRLRRRPDGRAFAYLALPADERPVHAVEVRRTSDARRFLVADANP